MSTVTTADTRATLWLGLGTGLVTALLWGSWAVVSRVGLTGALDFHDVTALRYTVSGIVLLPVLLRQRVNWHGIAGVPWHAIFLMLIGAGAPYALVVFAGLQVAPASHQAVIGPSGVLLFTAGLSALFLGERFDRRQLAGMTVVMAGVGAIGWHGLAGDTDIGRGHLLFVAATLLWSVFTVTARAWRIDALVATAIVSVVSFVTYLPFYLLIAGGRLLAAPVLEVAFQGIYQGLITGVIALALYMRTVALLGAGRAALFVSLVPAMAAAMAVPVLGEALTTSTLVGVVLVTIGMAIAVGRGAVGPGRAAATAGQSGGVVPGSKP